MSSYWSINIWICLIEMRTLRFRMTVSSADFYEKVWVQNIKKIKLQKLRGFRTNPNFIYKNAEETDTLKRTVDPNR